jgi:vacuolar-type H+-ATPase subunit I/STV1
MMAALTEKDDQIEDLQEEMRRLQTENERTRQTLAQVTKEKDASLDTSGYLKEELAGMRDALEQSRLLAVRKEDEFKRLLAEEDDLRMEVGTLKTTVCFLIFYGSWRVLINRRWKNKTPKLKDLFLCCKNLRKR